ncbi:unnamed protein product [Cyclocybe aegerita]|uniref:F-box domain-containing protein n=1 Tax=Cyclocybe aegerita TaxID=1973307 RepID=A0A8S0VUK9_CYCAE|nr:unnamed protein product [Cyclocybe aegerita]
MPSPRLPLELLYAIISHLGAEKDYASLCACASTCRALVSPAQARIFGSLTLRKESRTIPWLAKLQSTPHIQTYVKHLLLAQYHKPWIQHSEVLHRTLELLSPYVISLDIRHQVENTRFDFPVLSQLRCVEEISLTERDPEGLGDIVNRDHALPTFLNYFPNLRAITFNDCWVQVERASKGDIAAPIFRLERLYIHTCYDASVLDWLVPALSSLKTLHVQYTDPNSIPIFSDTAPSPPQLESLEHVEVRDLDRASNAELRSLMAAVGTNTINLLSITFMTSGSSSEHSPVKAVVQSLLILGAHRHLQHLAIGFFEEDDPVDGSPWDELQDLLLGGRFPALQSVKFLFSLYSSGTNPVAPEHFIHAVPRLALKKMISICYA